MRSDTNSAMLQLTVAMPIGDYFHFRYAFTRDVTALEGLFQALLKHSITLLCRTWSFQAVQSDIQQLSSTGVPVCCTV